VLKWLTGFSIGNVRKTVWVRRKLGQLNNLFYFVEENQ